MIDNNQKLLDFIVKYTWHVLDEDGAPAKLSYASIKMFEMDDIEIDMALKYLKEKKLITEYSFSNKKKGLRATAKGNDWSRVQFSRRDVKRWLIIEGLNPKLMEDEEWVNSRNDVNFNDDTYIYINGKRVKNLYKRINKNEVKN